MNNDVMPTPGQGFLLCKVLESGHIMRDAGDTPYCPFGICVHRETRNLGGVWGCYESFLHAKLMARGKDDYIILELTSEGGGGTIWVSKPSFEMIRKRLLKWKGCYGLWPCYAYEPVD